MKWTISIEMPNGTIVFGTGSSKAAAAQDLRSKITATASKRRDDARDYAADSEAFLSAASSALAEL